MIPSRWPGIATLCVALTACGAAPEKSVEQVRIAGFDGVPLSGSLADAKRAGFSRCSLDDFNVTCVGEGKSLLGIPSIKGEIVLHWPDGLEDAKRTEKNVRYGSVGYFFPSVAIDYSCDQKVDDPTACDKADGKGFVELQRQLLRKGWLEKDWRMTRFYVHEGVPIEITFDTSDDSPEPNVTISQIAMSDVAARVAAIRSARGENEHRQALGEAVNSLPTR